MLGGARSRIADDDRLLDEIGVLLDSLYVHFQNQAKPIEQ
jgi:hypothetical protein